MIDLEFIERLIRTLDDSGIDHVEIERGGTRVHISKTPAQAPSAPAVEPAVSRSVAAPAADPPSPTGQEPGSVEKQEAEEGSDLLEVTSPMVGTFYRAPSPDSDPFAEVGSAISIGDTLCIIEAMKLMNELEAEIEGVIQEVCVDNGEPVEYGQVLFRVRPA